MVNARTLSLLLLVVLAVACAPTDPVTRVDEARAKYTVQLNNWLDRTPSPPAAETAEEEVAEVAAVAAESAEAAAVEETMMGEGEEIEVDTGPQPISILFDIAVRFDGNDPLPGVTIELIQQDADGNAKETRRQYVETAGARRGSPKQVDFELDGFLVEEGDQFGVSIRQAVPPQDHGEYREYAEAAG